MAWKLSAAWIAIVLVAVSVPAAEHAAAAPAAGCAPVWYIGARGSGEPWKGDDHLGAELDYMATVIKSDLAARGLHMSLLSDTYDADSVNDLKPNATVTGDLKKGWLVRAAVEYVHTSVDRYDASIQQGISNAEYSVRTVLSDCPDAQIIMAGYSQGAIAVHDAENYLAKNDPARFSHIAGTLLLADGDRVRRTKARIFGTEPQSGEGVRVYLCLLKRLKICLVKPHDAPAPATTAEIANADDIVADFNLEHLLDFRKAAKVHTSYADTTNGKKLLARAASWVASKVGLRLNSPPSTNRPAVNIPRVPQARWNEPMGDEGMIIPAADGSLITTKCTYHSTTDADIPYTLQQVAPDGRLDWRRGTDNSDCFDNIRDSAGNDYYLMTNRAGAHIRSVNAQGWVRWTTSPLPHMIDTSGYGPPTLGTNGDIYFAVYNAYGTGYLLGVDEETGAVTVDQYLGFPVAIYAYSAGLVLADGSSTVEYLRYDGSTRATYDVSSIDFTRASFAGGTGGTIFAAGPSPASPCSGTTSFRVAKITPSGIAWTWTDPKASCTTYGDAAATPDGGVVTTEGPGTGAATGYVESLDQHGHQRWRMSLTTAGGLLFAATPMVDNHGIVVIPRYTQYNCVSMPGTCFGLQVLFASQTSSATSLATINATCETGSFPWGGNMAIANNRVYVTAVPYLDNTTYPTDGDALAALSAPGLGPDYRLSTQQG